VPQTFRFSEIEARIGPGQPGLYEIRTLSGEKLKVGITNDLRDRLADHRASRQSGLKLRPGGDWSRPDEVDSKKSILAKHLYYDEAIAPDYDLKTETGRRAFLSEACVILVEPNSSREKARELEKQREGQGGFRYVGDVIIRRRPGPRQPAAGADAVGAAHCGSQPRCRSAAIRWADELRFRR